MLAKVAEFCRKNSLLAPQDHVVVGVSGGPDSLCLLHVLTALSSNLGLTLTVAHLNHQLRGAESASDADFVHDIAAQWRLPAIIEARDVQAEANQYKESIEETARQVRYAFLWRAATAAGANKIAVGHNADDQVETVLMHFLRGTGLTGLRGMLPRIDIADLRLRRADMPVIPQAYSPSLIRPLLEISRIEIEEYCHNHNLVPRQDYSNQDTTFFRNRLRHELIPQLESYNPNIRQVLRRTARVITADAEILEEYAAKAWQAVVKHQSAQMITLDLAGWLDLPLGHKRSVLRRAVQILRRSLRDIGFEHIETTIEILEKGETGAQATLPQGLLLTINYQTFTIALHSPDRAVWPPSEINGPYLLKGQVISVQLPGITQLKPAGWKIVATLQPAGQVDQQQFDRGSRWEAYLDADIVGAEVMLRPRQPGDEFCPLGMGGHRKKVNEFMINEKIPAAWRDHIPLLTAENRVLWICGYRPDERVRLRDSTRRVLHLRLAPNDAPG